MATGGVVHRPFTHRKLVPSLTLHPQTQLFATICGVPSVWIHPQSVWDGADPGPPLLNRDREAAVAQWSVTGGATPPSS